MTEIPEQPDPKANAGDGKEGAPSPPPQEKTKPPDEPERERRNALWVAVIVIELVVFICFSLVWFSGQEARDMAAEKAKAAALAEAGKATAPAERGEAPEPARGKKRGRPYIFRDGDSVTIDFGKDFADKASSRYGKIAVIHRPVYVPEDITVNGRLEPSVRDDNEYKRILALFPMKDKDVWLVCFDSAGNSYTLVSEYRFLTMREDGAHAWSEPFEAPSRSSGLRVKRRGEEAVVMFLRNVDKSTAKEVVFADGGLTAKDFPLTAETLTHKCRELYRIYGEYDTSNTSQAEEGGIYDASREITHFDRKAFGRLIDAKSKQKKKKLIDYDAFKKRFCTR